MVTTPEKRFWAKVKKTKTCWIWSGAKSGGYGNMRIHGDEMMKAHRFSYELHLGKIPRGKDVLHTCDNPSCVNPKHLWLGTHTDNMRDMVKKGRNKSPMGEMQHSSKLTAKKILLIRWLREEKGLTQRKLALKFKVSQHSIYSILCGKTWKHI